MLSCGIRVCELICSDLADELLISQFAVSHWFPLTTTKLTCFDMYIVLFPVRKHSGYEGIVLPASHFKFFNSVLAVMPLFLLLNVKFGENVNQFGN